MGGSSAGIPSRPTEQNLARTLTVETHDLGEIVEVVGKLVTPHRLASIGASADVAARFHFRGAGQLVLFDVRFGARVGIDLNHPQIDRFTTFVVPTAGAIEAKFGARAFEANGERGVVFQRDVPQRLSYAADSETLVVLIDHVRLARHCGQLLGREHVRPLAFEPGFSLVSEPGRAWMRLVHHLRAEADQPASLLHVARFAVAQTEQLAMTTLLLTQPHNHLAALQQPQPTIAPLYVKRAKAFIEEHADERAVAGRPRGGGGGECPQPAERLPALRARLPMAHLKAMRLQRAHDRLLAADPQETSATEIVLGCGFPHLGQFAVDYKRRFAMIPRRARRG